MPNNEDSILEQLDQEAAALSEQDLQALVNSRTSRSAKPVAAPLNKEQKDPRDNEQWTFMFNYTDARGTQWKGKFTNKIMNMANLQQAAVAQSVLMGGQPLTSFASGMLELFNAIAHMTFSLIDRPEWAKDLTSIVDTNVILALWKEVASHETHYFRLGKD